MDLLDRCCTNDTELPVKVVASGDYKEIYSHEHVSTAEVLYKNRGGGVFITLYSVIYIVHLGFLW